MLYKLTRKIRDSVQLLRKSNRDIVINRFKKDGVGCEVGVWRGEFAHRILNQAKPERLYLIDPWMELPGKEKYKFQYQRQREMDTFRRLKRYIKNRTAIILRYTSDQAVQFIPEPLDYVYIDGDHSYEQVSKDLRNYYKLVKPGGVLAGDDYADENVARAVRDFCDEQHIPYEIKNGQFIINV